MKIIKMKLLNKGYKNRKRITVENVVGDLIILVLGMVLGDWYE